MNTGAIKQGMLLVTALESYRDTDSNGFAVELETLDTESKNLSGAATRLTLVHNPVLVLVLDLELVLGRA